MRFGRSIARPLLLAAGALGGSGIAAADILQSVPALGTLTPTLSWSTTATGQTPATQTGTGVNDGTGPVTVMDLTGNVASTYFFNDSFNFPNGSFAGAGTINGNNYGFVDSYVIDVPNSISSAFIFSLSLSSTTGLQNLSARLYQYSVPPPGVQNLTIGGIGPPSNGGVIDAWSPSSNGAIASTSLPQSNLNAGEYVLQVTGLETGGISGSYSGQLDITPVPLPAALPLLCGGLAALGFGVRRRRVLRA